MPIPAEQFLTLHRVWQFSSAVEALYVGVLVAFVVFAVLRG